MKKIVIILIMLIIVSSPVLAFSIKDILESFKEIFIGIKGAAPPVVCNEEEIRCGVQKECGGNPCIMQCSKNKWVEGVYCAEQCENGECTSSSALSSGTKSVVSNITNNTSSTENTNDVSRISTDTTGINNNNQPSIQQCSDQTLYNQCSINKPYFCDNGKLVQKCNTCGCQIEKECINNKCIEKDQPYDPGGEENNNPNILNIPPIINLISNKIIKIGESIQFKINAIDPNNDQLRYSLEPPEIILCSLSGNIVSCTGIKVGEEILIIKANDGKDQTKREVRIKVLGELSPFQRRVAAGIANTPPIADAGSNKIGIPGIPIILDASLSYDKEGFLSIPETYKWYENNNLIGEGKIIKKIFSRGTHQIKLVVTDSEGLTSEDIITVNIKEKTTCKNTQTIYFPEDTICSSKWPTQEGKEIKINSQGYSCSLFEVCSDELDNIVEESIKCCMEGLTDPNKAKACNFANENSENLKNCQALYTIKSLGKVAVYMDGYFDAEMCCKGVDVLCPDSDYLYTPQPLPKYLKGVKCSNTPENNPSGYWASDTKLELNEIALFDAPAHSSLNILKIGTCVDYSISATTILRKIGFSSKDIITVEASNHAYNLIRFNLDKKYTIFDMTGNNEGLTLGKVPSGYDYCENIINCYNDNGKIPCPSNKEIIGCENIKENIGRTTGTVGFKITNTLKDLIEKLKSEILR